MTAWSTSIIMILPMLLNVHIFSIITISFCRPQDTASTYPIWSHSGAKGKQDLK